MENIETETLKPVVWVGSSLKDLKKLPIEVQRGIGYALYRAQIGKNIIKQNH